MQLFDVRTQDKHANDVNVFNESKVRYGMCTNTHQWVITFTVTSVRIHFTFILHLSVTFLRFRLLLCSHLHN
jgi:accessory gene regulator protein AgrB